MNATAKPPAVAGQFYPGNPHELRAMVRGYLKVANMQPPCPEAIITPHAGLMFSGIIAAHALAPIAKRANEIKRVILWGPAHRVALQGLALPSVDYFMLPTGPIKIASNIINELCSQQYIEKNDTAFAQEHCLEVQLPFLQMLLPEFELVPILVGQYNPIHLADVMQQVWGGSETITIISSDLSHYHGYDEARQLDQDTSNAIISLNPDGLTADSACGRIPIQAMIEVAKQKQLSSQMIAYCNSGDTSGAKDKVVGYGAYHFH